MYRVGGSRLTKDQGTTVFLLHNLWLNFKKICNIYAQNNNSVMSVFFMLDFVVVL